MTEAMIVAYARNLDDTGLTGIFNELRQQITERKAITDWLKSWKEKIDYRYWQALLVKSFHLQQVRRAAEKRLSAADYIMEKLKTESNAQDLQGSQTSQPEGQNSSQRSNCVAWQTGDHKPATGVN